MFLCAERAENMRGKYLFAKYLPRISLFSASFVYPSTAAWAAANGN